MASTSQQGAFNAKMLDHARAFRLTDDARATINASPYRAHDLQRAMVGHLHAAVTAECRERIGWVILPLHVEQYICRAWDDCGSAFLALAEDAAADWPFDDLTARPAESYVPGVAA
jgi:hypothetical protein